MAHGETWRMVITISGYAQAAQLFTPVTATSWCIVWVPACCLGHRAPAMLLSAELPIVQPSKFLLCRALHLASHRVMHQLN